MAVWDIQDARCRLEDRRSPQTTAIAFGCRHPWNPVGRLVERVPQSVLGGTPGFSASPPPCFLLADGSYNAPMNTMSPDPAHPATSTGWSLAALVGWLLLTYSASATAATAVFVTTGGRYAGLIKPAWNPPSWVFGPAWTVLYAMMAFAAWRVWRQGGWARQKIPLVMFVVPWALNALWTPLFFRLQRPGWALAEILVLLIAILATLRAFWRVDRPAGLLLLPYAAWVVFATLLN